MLKYLIQKGYVDINRIMLESYHNIGLNERELVIVLKIFELIKSNQGSVSVGVLAKKTAMTTNECSDILNGLFNRGLVNITIECSKQGKNKECFHLDEIINYLSDYFISESKAYEVQQNTSLLKQITSLVEETFKRPLTSNELQIVTEWGQNGETLQTIQVALSMATSAKKLNIKYVDSCILAAKSQQSDVVLDENKTKILNEFYGNFK